MVPFRVKQMKKWASRYHSVSSGPSSDPICDGHNDKIVVHKLVGDVMMGANECIRNKKQLWLKP